jgi:DNA-binding transcriptional regulator YiaG
MDKEEIKELRNILGLSQQEFANKIGVGIATITRWEIGKCKPSRMANRKLIAIKHRTKKLIINNGGI